MNKTDTLEADAPAVPQEPVRNDMSIQLLERLIKTLTNLGYATPEGGIEAFNADLPTQLYHLCFGVDRVLSALKTAVPQEPVAWQPIETAPKGGSRVLLWWDGAVREGWCAGAGKSRDGGDWWRSHSPTVCAGRPTQWMPLPPAPEGAPQKSPVLTDAEVIRAIEHRFAPSPHPQRPRLTDAEILTLWAQTYVERGTSGIEFARVIEAAVMKKVTL